MIWLGLAISLAFIPGWTGASIPTSWAVLSCVLPLTLWKPIATSPIHRVLLLFLAYAFASWLWATNRNDAVMALWQLSILAGCFCLGSQVPLRQLVRGLAIGFSISSAVAVLQWGGFHPVLTNNRWPAGLAFNSMLHGEILALLIVALAIYGDWLWIPTLAPGLLLSGSRGAYTAAALGIVLTRLRQPILLAVGAAAVAFWATIHIGPSDSERFIIWQGALRYLTLFGNGPGSFLSLWFQHPGGPITTPEYVHNDALQLVYEYGVGATIPLACAAFLLARTQSQEWPLFATFVFLGIFSFPLYSPVASVIGALAAGRITSDWHLARCERRSRRLDLLSRGAASQPRTYPARWPVVSLEQRTQA